MTPRRAILLATLAGCALVAAPAFTGHGPRFIWNASASVPVGLYRIEPPGRIEVADLIAVMPPEPLGRDLPSWQGCRQLGDGEVFLMNWDAADSFDGRYFGPLPASSVVARAVPVWTDEEGDGRFRWRAADPALEP